MSAAHDSSPAGRLTAVSAGSDGRRAEATTGSDGRLLDVRDLTKTFTASSPLSVRLRRRTARRLVAIDAISLELGEQETLGLVGESGSGKSTVARCIVRLIEPDSGSIHFRDTDIRAAGGRELRDLRRHIQVVFQDPYSSLNPRLSVSDAISEAARAHHLVERGSEAARVAELVGRVGLPATVAGRRPRELSGGQRQRVAIARALAVQPSIIIADEAVSALDVSVQAQILNLFEELVAELGVSVIFISHQLAVIAHIAQRVAVMYLGRIVETGPTARVFAMPRHPYTAALLAAHPSVEPHSARPPALRGELPSPYDIPSGCRFNTRCPYAEQRCRELEPPKVEFGDGHVAWCHVLPDLRGVGTGTEAPSAPPGVAREPTATRAGHGAPESSG